MRKSWMVKKGMKWNFNKQKVIIKDIVEPKAVSSSKSMLEMASLLDAEQVNDGLSVTN